MGNSFRNCAPVDDHQGVIRPHKQHEGGIRKEVTGIQITQEEEEVVSYSDLQEVIKYNDSKFHHKFKNDEISLKPKGSIADQLQISYSMCSTKRFYCDIDDRRSIKRGPSSTRLSHQSGDSHSSCQCRDVFHRVISEGGDDSDQSEGYDINYDELIKDQIIDQDSMSSTFLSLFKREHGFSQTDGTLTEKSSSPSLSKKSQNDGSFLVGDDDMSQAANHQLNKDCSNCTLSCKYRDMSGHREELKNMTTHHEISRFYLHETCLIQSRHQSNSPQKRNKCDRITPSCDDGAVQDDKLNQSMEQKSIDLNSSLIAATQPQLRGAQSNNNIMNLAPPDVEDCCIQLKNNPSNKISLILNTQCKQKEDCELIERRKKLLKLVYKDRERKVFTKEYKLSRREIIYKTSVIIHKLIVQFMNRVIVRVDAEGKPLPRTEDQLCCWEVKQSSILFNEKLYAKRRGRFDSNVQGFSISKKKPLFVYHIEDTKERKEDLEQAPHQKIVEVFIMKIINRIKLSNEVCLLSLIFIERLAKKGGVQILSFNWKPICYTAILLAAKFWEDMNLWNRDFSDALDIYSHKAINQLESTFLALTNYELYVSEDLYDNYYEKIIKRTSKKKNKDKSTKDPSSDDGEEDEY